MLSADDALVHGCGLLEQLEPQAILLRLVPLRRALQLGLRLMLDGDSSLSRFNQLPRSAAAVTEMFRDSVGSWWEEDAARGEPSLRRFPLDGALLLFDRHTGLNARCEGEETAHLRMRARA